MEPLIQWWRSLALRERRLVSGGLLVLGLALLYLIAFEPAWVGRQKLVRELPQLRAQLAQMDGLSTEAKRIASVSASAESSATIRRNLEASLAAAGLKAFLSQGNFQGELIELKFNSVPFVQLAGWLDAAVRESRVRVVDANVQRDAAAGLVSARLALELPKRESR